MNAGIASQKLCTEEQLLRQAVNESYDDPVFFVENLFIWPEGGGPDDWQRSQLERVGDEFKANADAVIREAVSSGHGIGKSAEVAWIILWAMSTRPYLAGVVTANTESQLKTKTWRELSVWWKRLRNRHWFEWTATKFYHKASPEDWFVAAIPWSEHNPEAFAGLHADHVLVIYDEASAIPDIIWETSEGAMTTPRAMWFCFGNPTRNTGRFRECFGKFSHRWHCSKIDSRQCKMTNKEQLQQWQDDYGEDSDYFRVRVRGEFPRAGSLQFIPSDHVYEARRRELPLSVYGHMPVLLGVDVARFGDDQSVITVRQGRKLHIQYTYRELDTVQLSARVVEKIREWSPAATFVDGIGIGAGVVDQLRSLGYVVYDVVVSKAADEPDTYVNIRSEIWGRMREWLAGQPDIPDDSELDEHLTGIEYDYTPTKMQIRLEKKEDMKARGLSSPDLADSLALTFAAHIAPTIIEPASILPDDIETMDDY